MTHSEATTQIAAMLEAIQVLHAQARAISDEWDIPFDIVLEGGRAYNTTAEYAPTNGWNSSAYC